jgi:hypothetical protein
LAVPEHKNLIYSTKGFKDIMVRHEILSLRLRAKYGLEYFEKSVLRKCFGPNVKEQKKTVKKIT